MFFILVRADICDGIWQIFSERKRDTILEIIEIGYEVKICQAGYYFPPLICSGEPASSYLKCIKPIKKNSF